MMLINLLNGVISDDLLGQYIFYGAVFIVGLMVLVVIKKMDSRPNMSIAKTKTEKAIKLIEAMQNAGKKKDYFAFGKIAKLQGIVGDLVVLAEKEVTGNRNVAYDGVLTLYKKAFDQLNAEWLLLEKKAAEKKLQTLHNQLSKAKQLIENI